MADPPRSVRADADRARRIRGLAALLVLVATALAVRAAWHARLLPESDLLVEVGGAVERPGLEAVAPGTVAREVLAVAGPTVPFGDDPFLDLAVADGDRVELLDDGALHLESPREAMLLGRPVDVNAADAEVLATVPGLGPSTAAAVVADREVHGPFPSPDALERVPGVGPATVARARPLLVALLAPGTVVDLAGSAVRATPPRSDAPIDLNTASAVQLDTLPGIGPARAAAIVEDRARHGPFRAVSDLDRVPGIGPATLARVAPLATVAPPPAVESP